MYVIPYFTNNERHVARKQVYCCLYVDTGDDDINIQQALIRIEVLEQENKHLREMIEPKRVWPQWVKLHATEKRVLLLVRAAYPGIATHRQLFNLLYSHRADGGPEGRNFIHVCISQARKVFADKGIVIRNEIAVGWYMNAESVARFDELVPLCSPQLTRSNNNVD